MQVELALRDIRYAAFAREQELIWINRLCLLGCTDPTTPIRREIWMRIPGFTILATMAVLTASHAHAQTFGGNAPFCLQQWHWGGGGGTIYCGYSSMAQCSATASGLAAMCLTNPYFANAQVPREPAYRQPRRAY